MALEKTERMVQTDCFYDYVKQSILADLQLITWCSKASEDSMPADPAFGANLCNILTSPECNKLVEFHTGPVDSWSDWLMQFVDEEGGKKKRLSCLSSTLAFLK